MKRRAPLLAALAVAAAAAVVAAALSPGAETRTSSTFTVVATENFWGSIASQLGGDRVTVESIIVNPETDPHSYDPTPSDARTLAVSKVAIVNGIGYDN